MKNFFKAICALVLTFVVAGCGCNKQEKFRLTSTSYANDGEGRLVDETYQMLKNRMDNQESIIVFVYEATCMSCRSFTPIITQYVQDNDLIVYHVSIQEISKDKGLKKKFNATPGLMIIKDGKYYEGIDALTEGSADVFSKKSALADWIESRVYISID